MGGLGKVIGVRKCDNCGINVDIRHKDRMKRDHIFCSVQCESEYRKNKTVLNCKCDTCGKMFHKKQSHIDKCEHNYCSVACHREAKKQYMLKENNHQYGLTGSKNSSWKSDEKINSDGYRKIRTSDHPFKCKDDFVMEHRLVAELYLLNDTNSVCIDGKMYLSPNYIVHHIDLDKLNNDKENLLVMTLGEHMSLHHKLKNDNEYLSNYCITHNLDVNIINSRIAR
jgi:hypothetical protein